MSELPALGFSRTPLFILAAAMTVGLLSARLPLTQPKVVLVASAAASVGLALLSVVFARQRKTIGATICVTAAFIFAGLSLGVTDASARPRNRLPQLYEQKIVETGAPVDLTATLIGPAEQAPDRIFLRVRVHQLKFKQTEYDTSGEVLLTAHLSDDETRRSFAALELRHGARIRVMVALDREDNFRNPGVMRFTEYLERNDFEATGVIKSPLLVERLEDDSVFLPLAWLYDWREKLQEQFAARFSAETSGVLNAALLGNRHGLSQSAADRFRGGGTFHVLVISGMHISFIGVLVFAGSGWFTKKRVWRFLIATILIWSYTAAVGGDAPVARAALMFTLVILAPVLWRRANSLNAIGATAVLLLVWRPANLFDPSFQLTLMSVLAIVLLAVPVMERMQRVGSWRPTTVTPYPPACPIWFRTLSEALFWSEANFRAEMAASNISYRLFKTPVAANLERWHLQRLCRFMFSAVVVSASVQVAMLVPMIVYFHRLSLASLLLNIFVGGLMAVMSIMALAAVLVSQVSLSLAAPVVLLVEKLNWLLIHLVDPFTKLGVSSFRLPHYSGWSACVYALYYLPLAFLIIALARWNPLKSSAVVSRCRRGAGVAVTCQIVLVLAIVLHPFSAARPDGKLHVDFLDVGQGDSALLMMPDGTTLLIDGGGHPNIDWTRENDGDEEPFQRDTRTIGEGVVSEFLWSKGLDRVDYLVATHADADHIDGLNDVVRNFKVQGAIVARSPTRDAGFERFARSLNAAHVPMEIIGRSDSIDVGGVTIDVLWPPQTADVDSTYRNNDALLLRVRFGQRVLLFTADIEKEAETAVLKSGVDLHSDIVKVAHHGSRTSSTQGFVAATDPDVAVISVGRTSIFGHPHKEVVERWRASGAQVMTTGEKGTISVVSDGRSIAVSTFVR
ncbi:MAG TPA: ComEC/Rec2 family competence protein [Pyrinomonadaceae bacterium]|nr:ComEC/Rec2 family competence protein [Pyrinomonadaceae bacterium]